MKTFLSILLFIIFLSTPTWGQLACWEFYETFKNGDTSIINRFRNKNPEFLKCANLIYEKGQDLGKELKYYDAIKTYEILSKIFDAYLFILPDGHSKNIVLADYTYTLNNLGNLLSLTEEFSKAEKYLLKMKSIEEQIGTEAASFASTLNNLASNYHSMGDFRNAEKYYKNVLEIYDTLSNINYSYQARTLSNLGKTYREQGRNDEAIEILLKAQDIQLKLIEKDSTYKINYTSTLNNLGIHYIHSVKLKKAKTVLFEAKSILENSKQKSSLHYSHTLLNIGIFFMATRDFDQAEEYFQHHLALEISLMGKDHPRTTEAMLWGTYIYIAKKNWRKASEIVNKTVSLEKNNLLHILPVFSQRQRSLYLDKKAGSLDILGTIAQERPSNEIVSNFYDKVLIYKELLLELNSYWRKLVFEKGEEDLVEIFNLYREKVEFRNKRLNYSQNKQMDLIELEEEIEQLEKIILERLPNYKNKIENFKVDWQKIKSSLKPNEAAIEFIRYTNHNTSSADSINYTALVLRSEYEYPKMVVLGQEKELNDILATSIKNLYSRGVEDDGGIRLSKKTKENCDYSA